MEGGHSCTFFAPKSDNNIYSNDSKYFPTAVDTSRPKFSDIAGYLYNQPAKAALNRLLAERGIPDVAHLHIYYGRLTASILFPLHKRGIPIVQTAHEYKITCPIYTHFLNGKPCEKCVGRQGFDVLTSRCKNNSLSHSAVALAEQLTSKFLGSIDKISKFICVSEFQQSLMLRGGISSEKAQVIYNFASGDFFNRQREQPENGYLLYFGRLAAEKGIHTLVEAAIQSGIELVIAGDGELQDYVCSASLKHRNIRYCGLVHGADLISTLEQASAIVVPSEWYENCPMSVLEAKAMGIPVIGANIGGIPELVRHEIDGLLFQPGSVESLVSTLERFNKSDQQSFSAKAREDAEDRFSPKRYLNQLVDLYGSLLR